MLLDLYSRESIPSPEILDRTCLRPKSSSPGDSASENRAPAREVERRVRNRGIRIVNKHASHGVPMPERRKGVASLAPVFPR